MGLVFGPSKEEPFLSSGGKRLRIDGESREEYHRV
ncbi:hypothetical protein AALP_AAs46504U000200 [Arabis alpina]|uniref:Uncharacterized protein n=1 Tax=Arabis alpina TaxID=50452 RepID=A0A087G0U1_ARAAL|nr:hypothetical protein AALP_AAs46504U000200 [Arabis alpina]